MKSKVANFWCIVGISSLCTTYLYLAVRGLFLHLEGFGSNPPPASTSRLMCLMILPALFLYICGVAFFMKKGVACKMFAFPVIAATIFQFMVYFVTTTEGISSGGGWGFIFLLPVLGIVLLGLFIFGATRDYKERKRDYYY